MKISRILLYLSAIVGFIGTFWFSFGNVFMSGQDIRGLSGTFWDGNPNLEKALILQRLDSIIGLGLVGLAFLLQLVSMVIEGSRRDKQTQKAKLLISCSLLLVLLTAIVLRVRLIP